VNLARCWETPLVFLSGDIKIETVVLFAFKFKTSNVF
jgi:hypothetical protein